MRKLYPPPPPLALYSPKIKDVKMARFGFCAASSWVFDLGGMGVCCSILNSPKIKDAKMARFAFTQLHHGCLIWGAWGFAVPFYSVQDCRLDRLYQVKLEARLMQTKACGPHVLIRKTPCSNRKWSGSIYTTTDPGDWPHPSGSNIGNNTCTVKCIWRTPSLKGHKTNTHSWSLQSYRLLWPSLKADSSLRRRERYSSSHFESVNKILWCEHNSNETSSALPFI